MMLFFFVSFVPVIGGVIYYLFRWRISGGWVAVISIWLSVPVGIFLYLWIGALVAQLTDCQPIRREAMECAFAGVDISDWMNSRTGGGYLMAFFGLPWFLCGILCFAIAGVIRVVKSWSK